MDVPVKLTLEELGELNNEKGNEPAVPRLSTIVLVCTGTPAAVPVTVMLATPKLAKLLPDAQLSSWARIALEVIPGPAADEALRNAAASLERALRIEPRNPRLWNELAQVRLRQGQYAQAESLAARSNSWAGNDSALRADNARIIAEAREISGRSGR